MSDLLKKQLPPSETLILSPSPSKAINPSTFRLKLDLHILPILYFLLMIMFIDRANMGNVKIEGILEDLKMGGNDYNVALLVYTAPFFALELPSALMLRRVEPRAWVGAIMAGWGVCTIGCGLTRSYGGLLVCRFLVGSFEAGFLPCCAYLISQYYRRYEFQKRYTVFFTATSVGGAFGGFLAYALEKMDKKGGYAGWRWIFIMEGLVTLILSIAAFFLLVPLPENATFLTPDEKAFLLKKLEQDVKENSAESDTTPLGLREVVRIASNWKVVLTLIGYLSANIAAASTTSFQPTILKTLGFTASSSQIHTIPVYMTSMFCTLICAYFSDRLQLRYPFLLLGSLFCLLGWALELAAVKFIDPKTGLGWAGQRYAGMFCISIGESISIPVLVTWLSNNLRGRKERVVGLATLIGGAQAGNFVSANVFTTGQEKTGYKTGFATGLGIAIVAMVAGVVLFVGLLKENEKLGREAELEGSGELGAEGRGWRNTL